MCGRYTLKTSLEILVEQFEIDEGPPSLEPRYNAAPAQEVAAVVDGDGKRKLAMLRWGLIPAWARDPGLGNRMINARSETVAEKPSYRKPFKERRCLILADGFYEWRKTGSGKQPFYFRMEDGRPFAFAGLWEVWNKAEEIKSCTILTTEPNELVAEVHDRMPVILSPENYDAWLDPDLRDTQALQSLLVPYPPAGMESYPVSRRVNNPSNDDPTCVEPAERVH